MLFEAGMVKQRAEKLELLETAQWSFMADAVAVGISACLYAF